MNRISRRALFRGTALGMTLPRLTTEFAWARPDFLGSGKPAKFDATLYDRPGWCSHAWYHAVYDDGTIVVPIQSSNMALPYGDYIRTDTADLVMKSADSGRTWSSFRDPLLTNFPWGCYGLPGRASNGTLVSVICADYVATLEEKQEHLKKYKLQQYYPPQSEYLYRPWPIAMTDTLRKQGIAAFASEEGSGRLVFTLKDYVCRISKDNGKTWTNRRIDGLPYFSSEAGSFRNTLITRSGIWMASVFGTPNPNHDPDTGADFGSRQQPVGSYVLRSEDQGENWSLPQIGYDPSGEHSFDETALLELPSGRVLAMLRHTSWTDSKISKRFLYQSFSDDGGKTWSTPADTGIWGYPAHLLRLRDGRLLCTYGYRKDPWGHRAVLSSDEGKSWDVQATKCLRDDSLEGWTTYPMSSQLKDGRILTTYGNLKRLPPTSMAELKSPTAFLAGKQDNYVYAGYSLYDENFIRPFPVGLGLGEQF